MSRTCRDTQDNSVSIQWDAGTIGHWVNTQKRAQRVPLTQTIEYAHIYAKLYGYYPRLGLIYRNITLIWFVQILERRLMHFIRIARIVSRPVFFNISISPATISGVFIEMRFKFSLDLLKWLNIIPELEENENYSPLLKDNWFVRAGTGNQVTWIRLKHLNNTIIKMLAHQTLGDPILNRSDDNSIKSNIQLALPRITLHQQALLRHEHLMLDILNSIISMFFPSGQLIVSAQRINSSNAPELVAVIVSCQHGQSTSILSNCHNSELNGARSYVTLLDAVFSDMRRRDIQWVDFSYSTVLHEVPELSEGGTSRNSYLSPGHSSDY